MSSESHFILAIDLGTSGPKVALATVGGEIFGSEFEETQLILLPDGGAEQSTDDWWQAIDPVRCRWMRAGGPCPMPSSGWIRAAWSVICSNVTLT